MRAVHQLGHCCQRGHSTCVDAERMCILQLTGSVPHQCQRPDDELQRRLEKLDSLPVNSLLYAFREASSLSESTSQHRHAELSTAAVPPEHSGIIKDILDLVSCRSTTNGQQHDGAQGGLLPAKRKQEEATEVGGHGSYKRSTGRDADPTPHNTEPGCAAVCVDVPQRIRGGLGVVHQAQQQQQQQGGGRQRQHKQLQAESGIHLTHEQQHLPQQVAQQQAPHEQQQQQQQQQAPTVSGGVEGPPGGQQRSQMEPSVEGGGSVGRPAGGVAAAGGRALQDVKDMLQALSADQDSGCNWNALAAAIASSAGSSADLTDLPFDELEDDVIMLMLDRLVTATAGFMFCRKLLAACLLPRLLALKQAPPRAIVAATQSAAESQGRALVEAVLLPLLCSSELRPSHCQLLGKLNKEALSAPLRHQLMLGAVSATQGCGINNVVKDAHIIAIHGLLEAQTDMSQEDVDAFVLWWQEVSSQLPTNVTFVKMMLHLLNRHSSKLVKHAAAVKAVLGTTKTFLTKAVEAKLNALMQ